MTTTYTFKRADARALFQRAADAAVTAAADKCADQAVQLLNGPSPSAPGSPPGNDTGLLHQSIRHCSPQALGTPGKAAFGTALPYGRHQEFGAFITPKRAKYLLVPVDRALSQKLMKLGIGGARSVPGLKYMPPRKGSNNGGRLVLANTVKGINVRGRKKATRSAQAGTTVFVLKKSVVLKPRPWILRAAWMAAPAAQVAAYAAARKVFEPYRSKA